MLCFCISISISFKKIFFFFFRESNEKLLIQEESLLNIIFSIQNRFKIIEFGFIFKTRLRIHSKVY